MNFLGRGAHGELNGFLDVGSHLEGDLHFEQTFRVDGKVSGKVISDGDLVVGEKGEVVGEIRVGRVFVNGTVRGTIRAARRLEIGVRGRVFGELETPSLVIEEGAHFEGSCSMASPEAKSAEPTHPKVVGRISQGR
jgi:cytoskeletal protein CcmA (bactofilin family)